MRVRLINSTASSTGEKELLYRIQQFRRQRNNGPKDLPPSVPNTDRTSNFDPTTKDNPPWALSWVGGQNVTGSGSGPPLETT